jgi:exoribonuclease R
MRQSNQLIQEFMLQANMSVAKFIAKHRPDISLLRRHPSPLPHKLTELGDYLRSQGVDIDTSSGLALHRSIQQLVANGEDVKASIVQIVLTQAMQLAEYFCTGDESIDKKDWRHFALNVDYYCHFTSPIRRYPDIIVHRVLQSILTETELKYVPDTIIEYSDRSNARKLAAKKAQEASMELFMHVYVYKNGPFVENAYITAVLDRSIQVFVPRLALEQRIYVDKIDGTTLVYNQETRTGQLTYTESGSTIELRLFEEVQLNVSTTLNKGRFSFQVSLIAPDTAQPTPE